jgi:hypothetical protein
MPVNAFRRLLVVDSERQEERRSVERLLLTYRDEEAAKSAYSPVWKAWSNRVPGGKALNLDKIGERSDAVSGRDLSFAPGSKGILSQAQVGSVPLLTHGAAAAKVDLEDSLIAKRATLFAKRARQEQEGETPSASVTDA